MLCKHFPCKKKQGFISYSVLQVHLSGPHNSRLPEELGSPLEKVVPPSVQSSQVKKEETA